ncbi:MAG: nuclear transport factor 2 family protein [Gemmatimonadota bacterium]|nr:MAG: nuclear transport factor 2 family protein [Gemmatimonadota bacterium]
MRSVAFYAATVFSVVILSDACTPEVDQGATQAAALSQAERDSIGEMLMQWERDWQNGDLTGDPLVLERILAPDFIYTIHNGDVHDKASFIGLRATSPVTLTSFENQRMSVHWYADNVAVVVGLTAGTGTDADGADLSWSNAWTNVFVQRDGEWQCVVGHGHLTPASE